MPPKGAESKVQDPEYKNWLSVGLALYCLEVGLHSIIQGEVCNIRNTVMHSGGMRLSDTERKSFIQNIIHLLEDSVYLASVEECQQAVAELNKINHDSLDVVLNSDSKIKALRESENQFDPEVHVLKTEPKKTLESLNEELQNLRVHFGNFEKETRDNIVDLHTECQKMDTTITKLTRNVEYVASDISKFQKRLIETCRHPLVIQVSPKAERKRCNTENIYIDLIDIDERDQYTGIQIEDTNCEKSELTSYKQMFLENKGSRYKWIYFRGNGGIGKTTICQKLLHSWCKLHEIKTGNQSSAQNEMIAFEKEVELHKFKILFYVNPWDVSEEKALIEVICAQLPFEVEGCDENFLKALLKQNEDTVLFILDGLDELTPKVKFIECILNRTVYTNSSFIIPSKSWKVAQMELQAGPDIDLMLHLKGFSYNNAMRCAEKVLKSCYGDEYAIAQFQEEIKSITLTKQFDQVPLLFIVHVWYTNQRSLPNTHHQLYLLFLDVMVDQAKEKYKGYKQSWQMFFFSGDKMPSLLTKMSETSLMKTFGLGFLVSLSKVAHHFLLSSQKEKSMVFDETELVELLGDGGREKLDVALDLGILSVTNSGTYLGMKPSVCFLHKTMKEFFAAVYFSFNTDELENFISSMADLNDVLQNENIIVFLVGLDPHLGNLVLRKVCELCDNNPEIMHYRRKCPTLCIYYGCNICSLYQRCVEESSGADVQLYVSDMSLMGSKLNLNTLEPTFLRSICVQDLKSQEIIVDLRAMTGLQYLRLQLWNQNCELYLPQSGSLSVLFIAWSQLSSSCCKELGQALLKCTQLKALALYFTDLHTCELDLSNMIVLSELRLVAVTLSNSCCDLLGRTLVHCTQLKILEVNNTDLHSCELDLSNLLVLSQLRLVSAKLSSSCSYILGRTLTHCTHLKTLIMDTTNLHSCQFDVSNMTELSELRLVSLTLSTSCWDMLGLTVTHCTRLKTFEANNTNLQNCQFDLSNMTELSKVRLVSVILSISCCDVLGRTLTHCTHLKTLEMNNINFHNGQLDFSNMTELSELSLLSVTLSSNCCDMFGRTLTNCINLSTLGIYNTNLHNSMLDLSNITALTKLKLVSVALSTSCCDILGRSLTHCTRLETLEVNNTNLHNCQLDLSNMTALSELRLVSVTASDTCCDILGRTLTHCTRLETIEINNTNLHNCPLDMSNMTVLSELSLSGVTLSTGCCDVLGKTLTHCTQLWRLKLRNIDLHNCQLDLSNMTELSDVRLISVTLSTSCCEILGRTLTHCTRLETLEVNNTNLHNCRLDLSNMTVLSEISLVGTTLSSICCDLLGRALTHCTQLEKLEVNNTNLHNCLFDLSNMTVLSILILSSVTLSTSCCDIMGRTLTHCLHLEALEVNNTNLHNCLFDLSNMTIVSRLILRGVTLSSSCCDVLGRTLIHCSQLETLEVNNTYLHNCVLDLSNMTVLSEISLVSVTLSNSCCDELGRTLTHCIGLETLELNNIYLHNCQLDLSNMTVLSELRLVSVTLSDTCCDILGKCLTHCTQLEMLEMNNTNLHNCQLDLSNMTVLSELRLVSLTLSDTCCDILGRTLTHCTRLETIEINNTNLHNCQLDLSNMTVLSELRLVSVTLSDSCCEVLRKTLTHCSQLRTLEIRNTNLHNCQLDLSHMKVLSELRLV